MTNWKGALIALAAATPMFAQEPAQTPKNAAPAPEKAETAKPDVVLTVNGIVFTREAAEGRLAQVMKGADGVIPKHQIGRVREREWKRILDKFEKWAAIVSEADRRKLISPEREKQEIERVKGSLGPEKDWAALAAETAGGETQLRMEILGNLKVRTLLDSFETNTYTVSQEEIAAYREKNQGKLQRPESVAARHILLRVNDGDDDAAKAAKKKKIEEIREQIVAGADFGEMAKQHSDCPSKEKGGDLGEFGRKQMVKPFADAAFSQEVDAVGPVVETKFGYHIIQVTKHAQPRELTDADITTVMERDKRRREIDAFVGELHAKAKIERTDGRP